jgi:hypothetical protein
MLRTPRFFLILLCLTGVAAGTRADTITLRNGDRIEGSITNETPAEVTVKYQVSAGISDERVIRKTEILKVDRIAADETAYRAIMDFQPGKSSFQPAQYDGMISALQGFIVQFPESVHGKAAEKAMTALGVEKKKVDAGEVKFDGVWLSREEAQKQQVQIGGNAIFAAMKSANARGDAIGALNALVQLEKNFPGAKVMPDAVSLAQQILAALKPAAERALATYKHTNAERARGVAAAGPAEKAEMIAAFQRDQTRAEAAITAATAAKTWPPFMTGSDKSIAAILAKIPAEAKRLEAIPVADMRESIKLADKARIEFASKNVETASDLLQQVLKLWPANELGLQLKAQIAGSKIPSKPAPVVPAATPAPAPAAATPGPKPPAAAPIPAPIPAPSPELQPTPTTPEGETPAKPAEPEAKPFLMTLPGAITIVVALAVILAGANIFSHFSKRREDAQE